MSLLAIQYLEPSPDLDQLTTADVRARLRAASIILPIDYVLVGWDLPRRLLDACAAEAAAAGAALFRWHPLLTGDGMLTPRADWRVIGLNGQPVPGFQGMDEFTFLCPNRPAVQEAVLARLAGLARSGDYAGFFLDRIRFPSPAAQPEQALGCFCPECRRAAAAVGLDLEAVRAAVGRLLADPGRARWALQQLLQHRGPAPDDGDLAALQRLLDFRCHSITAFVQRAASILRAEKMQVGLDCFSPALAGMVGQDPRALDACCDWIKIMSYGHTLGPAGLPFELLGLADWLVGRHGVAEDQALAWLAAAGDLPLPASRAALRMQGLAPDALAVEARRGRAAGVSTLLFGIELNDVEGVAQLERSQIQADLAAVQAAGVDGLALSWDLRHMPLDRLELVWDVWE